jgi:hypothetical protein
MIENHRMALVSQPARQANPHDVFHYCPGAVPLLVVKQLGKRPIALLDLECFAQLVGIREPKTGEQLALLGGSNS